jgi:hypothetical protein
LIEPEDAYCGDDDCGEEDVGAAIVSGGDAAAGVAPIKPDKGLGWLTAQR